MCDVQMWAGICTVVMCDEIMTGEENCCHFFRLRSFSLFVEMISLSTVCGDDQLRIPAWQADVLPNTISHAPVVSDQMTTVSLVGLNTAPLLLKALFNSSTIHAALS